MLRDYQQRTIDMLYQWFREGNKGNPCLMLPTGSGKSHIVAALCKDAIKSWPQTRILMLTHQKELIEQNAEKMRQHWPGAPLGIYSASVGRRDEGEPITFAGIQSVRNKSSMIGRVDLIIIDECHMVSHRDEGSYRNLIKELREINPNIRVIGLTASPYRLGHGLITEGEGLFDDIIEPVTIEELIHKGYLAPLRSKITREKLDVTGVKKRGGEYVESDLQRAVDTAEHNSAVVDEVISLADGRKSWLFFCSGVNHAQHIAEILNDRGIVASCVTGATPKKERERILDDFKSGEIQAVTNANVLTTGFDAPDIDLIAMLRPTMSATLYIQMAGRGMRPKSHTDHCLFLDFAGVVAQHGPIVNVRPPKKGGNGDGVAPVKVCPECDELVHLSVMKCPSCGHQFESPEKTYTLHSDDIMGVHGIEMPVTSWRWRKHTSKTSGKDMLAVTYYGALSDKPVTEYLTVTHGGVVGQKAIQRLSDIAIESGAEDALIQNSLSDAALILNQSTPPSVIEFQRNGRFFDVKKRSWNVTIQDA